MRGRGMLIIADSALLMRPRLLFCLQASILLLIVAVIIAGSMDDMGARFSSDDSNVITSMPNHANG